MPAPPSAPHPRRLPISTAAFAMAVLVVSGAGSGCAILFGGAPSQAFVAGVVSARSETPVPPDARVVVTLEAMQADSSYLPIRTITVERGGRSLPLGYRIYYAADSLETSRAYALRAVVEGSGLASPHVPVLTQGGGRSADLVLGDPVGAEPKGLRVAPPVPARLPGSDARSTDVRPAGN